MPDTVQLGYQEGEAQSTARPLHLHTLDSLLADLVSGRAVFIGEETSFALANAIIWTLTGQILRPQREPEQANEEFEWWVAAPDGSEEVTTHRLTPVTPMPDVAQYRPEQVWVPADTWVELTFKDEDGTVLP